jgi:hypothetical protein
MKCDLEIEAFRKFAAKRFEQIGGLAACVGASRFKSSYVVSTLDAWKSEGTNLDHSQGFYRNVAFREVDEILSGTDFAGGSIVIFQCGWYDAPSIEMEFLGGISYFFCGSHCYFYTNLWTKNVLLRWRELSPSFDNAAFVIKNLPKGVSLTSGCTLPNGQIPLLAEQASACLLNAYDDETFVIAER